MENSFGNFHEDPECEPFNRKLRKFSGIAFFELNYGYFSRGCRNSGKRSQLQFANVYCQKCKKKKPFGALFYLHVRFHNKKRINFHMKRFARGLVLVNVLYEQRMIFPLHDD